MLGSNHIVVLNVDFNFPKMIIAVLLVDHQHRNTVFFKTISN